jgi:hypothetical protein
VRREQFFVYLMGLYRTFNVESGAFQPTIPTAIQANSPLRSLLNWCQPPTRVVPANDPIEAMYRK